MRRRGYVVVRGYVVGRWVFTEMKVRTTKDEESLNRSRRMEKKMNNWVSFFVSAGFRNLIVNLGV